MVGVLSLALGIGATTAMFRLMYAVLLHPFPYAGADRIMNPAIVNDNDPSQQWWFPLWKSQFDEFAKAQGIESLLGFNNKTVVQGRGISNPRPATNSGKWATPRMSTRST
jgi:hypothetical protein